MRKRDNYRQRFLHQLFCRRSLKGLIWKGGWIILPSVQKHFIKNNCATYDIPNLPVSRYWTKLRRGYFRFPDFWSNSNKGKLSLDQKLNLARGARQRLKKIDEDVISSNCDVIVIFSDLLPIWSNPEAGFRIHGL